MEEERFLRQNPWNLIRYKTDDLLPWPLSERYLCTTLPKHQPWSRERLICASILKQDVWRHTLRISSPSQLDIKNVWSEDRFDHQDHEFFVIESGAPDFIMLDVTWSYPYQVSEATSTWVHMMGTIIALGWSEDRCLFSIFTYDEADYSFLKRIRADSMEQTRPSQYLQGQLALSNIPRTPFISEVVTSTQPMVAVLSINVKKSSDSSHYDLSISGNFCEESYLPEVKGLYWNIGDDDYSNVAEYGRALARHAQTLPTYASSHGSKRKRGEDST